MKAFLELLLTALFILTVVPRASAQVPWLYSTEQGYCGGTRQVTLSNGSVIPVTLTQGESDTRQALWARGADINKCPCPPATDFHKVRGSCTSVEGLASAVVEGIGGLERLNGARLIITGGTEMGHKEHKVGTQVDIKATPRFVGTMLDNFASTDVFIQPGRERPSIYYGQPHSVVPNYVYENAPWAECDASTDENACRMGTNPDDKHWHINFDPVRNVGDATLVSDTSTDGGGGAVTAKGIDFLFQACPLGVACGFAQLPIGIRINVVAVPDPNSLLGQWQGVDSSSGLNATFTLKRTSFSRAIHALFVPNQPPPDDPGCWSWNSTLGNGSGGWQWICPSKPNPCWGAATLSVSCQRKPQSGCWYWDSTAGTQGAWIYDPNCGGDPSRRDPDPPITIAGTINVAGDPNDKQGAQGAGLAHYLAGNELLRYAVLFENIPTASAPATTVVIQDPLDTSKVDITTLKLGPVSFGSHTFTLPPVELASIGAYTTNFDLRPTENMGLRVGVSLSASTGVLTWTLTTLDPATGMPPADPLVGFLAPGEEGSVQFSIAPKAGMATNTQLTNQATIVFNLNAPMSTPVWSNLIDSTPPTSAVSQLPSTEPPTGFKVSWTGMDVGSGIRDFTIYVSDNGGPFTPFQTNTTATSATFTGQVGHTYDFYSIARDLVGNVEGAKTAAEATTQVTLVTDTTTPVTVAIVSPQPNAAGWNNSNVTVALNSADNEPGGTGVKQISYSATGAQPISSTVVNGASTSFTITAEGITTITFFGTDNAGNIETARTITIRIDKTPPAVACSASPNVLWPPNNQLAPINVSVNVTDSISGPAVFNLVSVTSSEPDSGLGDIQGFVVGTPSTSGQLRAQRLGSGSGRTYTFVYSGADRAGNATSCAATVIVPHDQGH